MMRVVIVGSGYVGLVTGIGLARLGHDVLCVERDADRVIRINRGDSPIHEVGLVDELRAAIREGRFSATTELASAAARADVIMLAVGTPSTEGRIDLTDVLAAADQVGRALSGAAFQVVAIKSTVIPGTSDTAVRAAIEKASGLTAGVDFGLAVNPEFLTEGRAVADFMHPDRIVIGADDERSAGVMRQLYAAFAGIPLIEVNMRTAELTKYASNALLATAISFSNELANLAEAVGGIDMLDVMAGLHASRYLTVGVDQERTTVELASFLLAGCGFGGSCLPKDVSALVSAGADLGEPMPLLQAVLAINQRRADRMVRLVQSRLPVLRGMRIGALGLAFKPDTGDVRESPAFPVIAALTAEGAEVFAHDPVVRQKDLAAMGMDGVPLVERLEDIVGSVDALVLITAWSEYERLPQLLAGMSDPPLLVDGRRVIAPDAVPAYRGIGLG